MAAAAFHLEFQTMGILDLASGIVCLDASLFSHTTS